MTIKRTIIAMSLICLLAGATFARGTRDKARYGNRGLYDMAWTEDVTVESFTGKFALEDQYAVLETSDSERYYLVPGVPIVGNLPEEGDELAIEAFRSPMAPNILEVVSAKVNGVAITPEDRSSYDYIREDEYYDDDQENYYGREWNDYPGDWGRSNRRGWGGPRGGWGGSRGGWGGSRGGRGGSRGGYYGGYGCY